MFAKFYGAKDRGIGMFRSLSVPRALPCRRLAVPRKYTLNIYEKTNMKTKSRPSF